MSEQIVLCEICDSSADHGGDANFCASCTRWFHQHCVGLQPNDSCVRDEGECWECPLCRQAANGLLGANLVDVDNVIVYAATQTQHYDPSQDPLAFSQSQQVPAASFTQLQQSQDPTPSSQSQIRREEITDDRFDLSPFLDPTVPGPVTGPLPQDEDGWVTIDSWGAWDCASTCIAPMEEVPGPYRKAWSTAMSTVLRRLRQAGGDQEITRALKWFLALPKLLLREPKRGGQKGQGTGEVAARFESVREGNWGNLLVLLKKDEDLEQRHQNNRRIRDDQEDPVFQESLC